jgi:hypothetical protein
MGKVKEMMMEQQNNDREQDFLIAELDHENRLMRARNERLEQELAQARDKAIEEVAVAMEQFTFAFGVDTVSSFTIFVRGLKG